MADDKKLLKQPTSNSVFMMLQEPSTKALAFVMATFGIFASDYLMGGALIYSRIKKAPISIILFGMMTTRALWYQTVRSIAQGGQLNKEIIQSTNLSGKFVVITGATSGIGKSTAIQILKWGAKIIIGYRDENKARAVISELVNETGVSEDYIFMAPLSLDDMNSVKSFADTVLANFPKIDMLFNNAGIMAPKVGSFSKDSVDIQFATNHLGHFFLTKLLLSSIKKQNGKIINISSAAHSFFPDKNPNIINYIKPSLERYNSTAQYAFSKICNIWFTRKLQQKLWEDPSTTATTYAIHPGVVKTDLARPTNIFIRSIYYLLGPILFKNSQSGAATQLMVAACPKDELFPGRFYADCAISSVTPLAISHTHAEELWKSSEDMIKSYSEN